METHNETPFESQPMNQKPKKEKGADAEQTGEKAQASGPDSAEVVTVAKAEYEKLEQSAAEFKDKFLRSAAEMENLRRRVEREKQDLLSYGQEKVMLELLTVYDSFERALPNGEKPADQGAQEDGLVAGMQLVKKQLRDALSKNGVEAINALGQPFDPNFHQAIKRSVSKDVTKETVTEEFVKGYTLNGRLLRAAMVAVTVPE